ncbi:MAG: pyruvate kinase alpha/beta domain-containing protein, partial [Candidatus Thorarchaeota archaeon]
MKIETVYFEEASPEHTERVLEVVRRYLDKYPDMEHVVVATTEGHTGALAAREFADRRVVVVTHQTGFIAPNFNELDEEQRKAIEEHGAKILTATHAFAGIARSFRKELGTWTPT